MKTKTKDLKIFVNEQVLEASLNEEKNLEEVYNSFNEWIVEKNHYILSVKIDKNEIPLTKLKEIAIDDVERLDFYIGNELDMLLASVDELDYYLDQVGSTLFEQEELNKKDCENLEEGIKWVHEILLSIASIMKTDLETISILSADASEMKNLHNILKDLEAYLKSFQKKHGREEISLFLEELRLLKLFVMRLVMQLRSMSADINELLEIVLNFSKQIPKLKSDLTTINSNFQRGKDVQALDELENMTAKLNLCISALYALDCRVQEKSKDKAKKLSIHDITLDTISFYQIITKLTLLLQNLSEALERGDIVSLGDILEYELSDELDRIQPYLQKICDLCKTYILEGRFVIDQKETALGEKKISTDQLVSSNIAIEEKLPAKATR